MLDNLVVLGFTDSKKLIDLISNNLQVVLEINKEICNQVLSNNTLDDSVEVNGTSYFIGTKDIKEVKKGIYFTESGLIREMLSLSLGESWYNVYKRKK
ncbi:hypothetical protein D3C80_978900 [compost metagenome]